MNPKQIAKATWSGENVLVNNCGDGVPCTEEQHQLNRRTEITVSEVNKTILSGLGNKKE